MQNRAELHGLFTRELAELTLLGQMDNGVSVKSSRDTFGLNPTRLLGTPGEIARISEMMSRQESFDFEPVADLGRLDQRSRARSAAAVVNRQSPMPGWTRTKSTLLPGLLRLFW